MSGPRRPNGKADRVQRAYERGKQDAKKMGSEPEDNPFKVNLTRSAWMRGFTEMKS